MIVFINGKEIRFINTSRALNVAKKNETVVFGLCESKQEEVPEFVRAIYKKLEVVK